MSSIRDPHAAGHVPHAATQQEASAAPKTRQRRAPSAPATDAASTHGSASPGAQKTAHASGSTLGQVKNQFVSHGGLMGALTLKGLGALLSVGGYAWVGTHVCEQVPSNHPPMSFWNTAANMAKGGLAGGLSTMVIAGVPLGIVGAAMSAAGPAAIPILATLGALVLYGTVMGAYQGFKASRPPNPKSIRLNAQSENPPPMQVTIDHDPQITLDIHHLGRAPTLPSFSDWTWNERPQDAGFDSASEDGILSHRFQDGYKTTEAADAAREAIQSENKMGLAAGLKPNKLKQS